MTKINTVLGITKSLSSNDVGLTGGHQSGILVPKKEEILSFFPKLGVSQKNPRYILTFLDENNESWEFAFIYYNNKIFGGTRDEYRLTRMTGYIRRNNLKVGDEIILSSDEDGVKRILYNRLSKQEGTKLKLSGEWKTITIKNS